MDNTSTLPWKQLFLINLCRLIMIKDLNLTTEENIGYYCGLITSVNAMALFISSIPLGSLSDRIGRKPVILIGLIASSFGLLLFGLGKSFAWLMTVKLFSGIMNGNAGVLKSMVAEVTREYSAPKKAQAFLFLHITFNVGMIVATALGGYLSEPVTKFPNIFKEGSWVTNLLKEHPYFLPCFIGFIMSITATILCLFKMKETLPKNLLKKQSEETPLLQQEQQEQQEVTGSSEPHTRNKKQSIGEILTPSILFICAIYCLPVFQFDYLRVFFPIWASTPVDKGGLGFQTSEIGTLLSYSTAIMTIALVLLLDPLTRRFSMSQIIKYCVLAATLASFILGLFRIPSLLLSGKVMELWIGLLVSMSIQSLGQSMSIILSVILLNNVAVHADTLGLINAFAQSCGSATKIISPMITGFFWSSTLQMTWIPLDVRSYINWAILGIFGIFTFFLCTRLDPTHNAKTNR